jgi:ribosomal protein S18 acetylase RimI-like enzyme
MRIDPATLADLPRLAEMNQRLIEDEGHPNPMTVAELAERMAQWLAGEYAAHVLREGDEIAAYALIRDDGETWYLRHLYVERSHRRQGLATALLDWLYAHVWTDKPVRLDVLAHNTAAIAFYEAYGFKVGCLRMEK